jgi:serine protease Do
MSLADYIANARKSVVRVETSSGQGTGVVVKPAIVLTNAHVVKGESLVSVIDDSNVKAPGKIFYRDETQDLAVISVLGAHWPPIGLADLSRVRDGDDVFAVGHPLGLSFTVTKGIISARSREYDGQTYIQTDTAINPGNSGGPLLDARGRLVAINTFLLRGASGLNFAIPIDRALTVISLALEDTSRANDLHCPACMNPVPEEQPYCPKCGREMKPFESPTSSPRVVTCSGCRTPNEPANIYCHTCGKDLRNQS